MILPTLKQIAMAGVFVGAGLGGYITARMGSPAAAAETPLSEKRLAAIEQKLGEIGGQVVDIKSDVRLLKCKAGFPGDCPKP